LTNNEKIYIHCRGGHGRAGLVVACILSSICKISAIEAIKQTNEFHNNRKIMKIRWRKLGSPQTKKQKDFISEFCSFIKLLQMIT